MTDESDERASESAVVIANEAEGRGDESEASPHGHGWLIKRGDFRRATNKDNGRYGGKERMKRKTG